jgi:hypothetical protein
MARITSTRAAFRQASSLVPGLGGTESQCAATRMTCDGSFLLAGTRIIMFVTFDVASAQANSVGSASIALVADSHHVVRLRYFSLG